MKVFRNFGEGVWVRVLKWGFGKDRVFLEGGISPNLSVSRRV